MKTPSYEYELLTGEEPAQPEPVEEYTYETDRAIGAQVADASAVEPAAPEIPEAVKYAAEILRLYAAASTRNGRYKDAQVQSAAADALESFWRTHTAQPAPAVAMAEELRCVLHYLELALDDSTAFAKLRGVTSFVSRRRSDLAAVRVQAAEAGIKLPKVRDILESLIREDWPPGEYDAAIAELNAAEGRK